MRPPVGGGWKAGLALALVFAALALAAPRWPVRPGAAILLATRAARTGQTLTGSLGRGHRPATSIGDELPASEAEVVADLPLRRPIAAGEPVTWRHFANPDERGRR